MRFGSMGKQEGCARGEQCHLSLGEVFHTQMPYSISSIYNLFAHVYQSGNTTLAGARNQSSSWAKAALLPSSCCRLSGIKSLKTGIFRFEGDPFASGNYVTLWEEQTCRPFGKFHESQNPQDGAS